MMSRYILIFLFYLARPGFCYIDEIEATPTNTNALELGDLSMPQFLVFCAVFLLVVTLYAVEVVPVEVDLGYFYGTGSGDLFPRRKREAVISNLCVFCIHMGPYTYGWALHCEATYVG